MSPAQLPDFEEACAAAEGSLGPGGLSECHGVACGLLCAVPQTGAHRFMEALSELELAPAQSSELQQALERVFRAAAEQLPDPQMRFAIWLPPDDEPLDERTEALARWCSGLLAGLGVSGGGIEGLPAETLEALEDVRRIAGAEVEGEGDAEEEETAFAEIVEYVRVVVMMLYEDLRGSGGQEQTDAGAGT